MYKDESIKNHRGRIKNAVENLFQMAIKNQKIEDDILCFLNNGKNYNGENMFGPGNRGITDYTHKEFLVDFMNSNVESELLNNIQSDEDKERIIHYSLNIELMIYSHLWETEWSLSNLIHLRNYIEGKDYDWKLSIPWNNKPKLITKDIGGVFRKYGLEIANLINEAYNSQLRNAFAHGQYGIIADVIYLYNYSQGGKGIPAITLQEWEDKFVKTVELFIQLENQKFNLLKEYSKNKPKARIWTPIAKGCRRTCISWNKLNGFYNFT